MRKSLPAALERCRMTDGPLGSDASWGAYGAFILYPERGPKTQLMIVASGGDPDDTMSDGWEHVSVSTATRCPTWDEMALVKDAFWDEHETVVQFHPPRTEYVNNHPYCLHLWKPPVPVALPPRILVGVKSTGLIDSGTAAVLHARILAKTEGLP